MEKLSIGIDIGATNVRVCLGNEKGEIKSKLSEKLDVESRDSISQQIKRMIKSLNANDFSSIGIGAAGPLDLKRGEISPVNIPVRNVPIVNPLKEKFNVPVYFVNDCDAGVVGEKIFGLGKDENHLAYLTLSSGIGCGIIIDGKILLGKDGNATEKGHHVIDYEGRLKCGCGVYGHWEAYTSGKNIPNFVKMLTNNDIRLKSSLIFKLTDNNLDNLTSEKFFEVAGMKDELALEIVEKIGMINAIGISNINAAYDVSLVTIGGSVVLKNPELILDPIIKYVSNYSINTIPKISITPLGEDIVLYGALALAFNYEKFVTNV